MANAVKEDRKKLTGEVVVREQTHNEVRASVQGLNDVQSLLRQQGVHSITELVDRLFVAAVLLNASDVHLEPGETTVAVRFRIDGVLHAAGELDSSFYEEILSRIKLVSSGIKLNVRERPQDGRFSLFLPKNAQVEVRVSTLPAEYGEALVMRVLNPQNILELHQLGLRQDLEKMFREEITNQNGMIVVTGPTGSGKTSTLYAFLKEIAKPEIKIVTIEDPIEYHLGGISQTQVNQKKGYDFVSGLQAIVRQDPDVILVGEMRNEETVQIALQAALTGHFVLTTLHTNDAPGTFFRLVSLKAKPSLIASALTLVIAQRLVRKVCSECMTLAPATAEIKKKFRRAFEILPQKTRPSLPEQFEVPNAVGCKLCNNTGYNGRIGIFEAISVNEAMEPLIIKNPPISKIKEFAVNQGMMPMYQDGLLKVLEHTTTLEEVERETTE